MNIIANIAMITVIAADKCFLGSSTWLGILQCEGNRMHKQNYLKGTVHLLWKPFWLGLSAYRHKPLTRPQGNGWGDRGRGCGGKN